MAANRSALLEIWKKFNFMSTALGKYVAKQGQSYTLFVKTQSQMEECQMHCLRKHLPKYVNCTAFFIVEGASTTVLYLLS